MYMAVALLVWVAWIINPNSLHYMSPDFIGGFFLPYCEFTFLLISCGKSLPMKFLLLLLYSLSNGFLKAQDCRDHLLMQKWVQLEYLYCWKMHDDPDNAVSRLLYQVDQVTDSAGSTWSSITKRGFSIASPWFNYQRKIVLQCDGQHLLFPYDFFFTDTIYTRDFFPLRKMQPMIRNQQSPGYISIGTWVW